MNDVSGVKRGKRRQYETEESGSKMASNQEVKMQFNEFPYEVFIKIEDDNFFVGRITLNEIGSQYYAEIDIVHSETKKIYQNVDILYGHTSPEEALDTAVQKLSNFLRGKET